MGRLVPNVVAAGEGCDVQASGHGGKNNDHPGHDARVLEPEESRHNDLELHSSRALTAQAATRGPTFFDGQRQRGRNTRNAAMRLTAFLTLLYYTWRNFRVNVSQTPPAPKRDARDSRVGPHRVRVDGLRPLLALQPLPRKEAEVE